ncbi:hypothetical protein H101_02494 [Trichophyton interdigitale H6]|nr:hypothetical protein H101_02494 [Trichophyton interdigitale H6]
MRLNAQLASLLLSSIVLVGSAHGADEEPVTEKKETSSIERPTFVPTAIKAPFLEQFTDKWDSRWSVSHAKKEDAKSDEEWAYVGEWSVEEPTVFKGIEGDKGLVVKNPAAHHAISAKFPKKIDNKGKTLVVQYEVKLQNSLSCGGAYMKLLQENKKLHSEEFSNASPYVIMFGPDRCGATNKVHFIFKHKNPKTGEYEEKHLKAPPAVKVTKLTSLYTLIVNPDQTFQIRIDGEPLKNGTLLEDFAPAVNPPNEIDDEKDTKPADWVDEEKIPDPEAKKPEDWDEDAPFEIVDTEATKPADWLDDEPTTIPDPEAVKPEDWDDEEDGDWVAPTVPNPKCEEGSGCGKWEPPMIRNPAYKGKWSAPLIDNPAYKGVWAPRKIPNPNYFEDKTPSNFEPMGAIGFEIWTMQNDILFDNIYIGHSIEDAEKFKAETYDIKRPIEEAEEQASKPKLSPQVDDETEISFTQDPIGYVRAKIDRFTSLAQDDPVAALQAVPEVGGAIGAILASLLIIIGMFGLSSPAPPAKSTGKAAEKTEKEKTTEAVTASGADSGQGEAKKRAAKSG